MSLSTEQRTELEKLAAENSGQCPTCSHAIKFYHYKLNKIHAIFLRAMAAEVRNTDVNDVDISTIGLAYSVRSQVTKMRQHGLIARIKNADGSQVARHWLITSKGWQFLNGHPVPSRVTIYNNQVLGHGGDTVHIKELLGEVFDPDEPIYNETPISTPEARTYENVRQPVKYMLVKAVFKGRDIAGKFKVSQTYELQIKRLQIGKPVELVGIDGQPYSRGYDDIHRFYKDWKIV